MKYIQSFYQYPVTFSSIGKTIPARNAVGEMKNIAEVSEKELEKLQTNEPFFRELLDKKKIRVLNKMPASYVPPAQRINEAQAETERYKAENEALKAKLAALEASQQAAPAEVETVSDGATTNDVDSTDSAPAEGKTKKARPSKKGKK